MNFGSNGGNNSRDNEVSVNTKSRQYMNKNGFFASTLTVGFWNDLVSLKVAPALDRTKQTDTKTWDYQATVSTAITTDKAATLARYIEEKVFANIAAGVEDFRAVQIGGYNGNSLVGVGTRNIEGRGTVAYFAIYKSLDETTKKPEVAVWYEFNTTIAILNYNPETGELGVENGVQSEFHEFFDILKQARVSLYHAGYHSDTFSDKNNQYGGDSIRERLDTIGAKQVGKSGGGGWNKGGGGNFFSSGNNNNSAPPKTTEYEAEVEQSSSFSSVQDYL